MVMQDSMIKIGVQKQGRNVQAKVDISRLKCCALEIFLSGHSKEQNATVLAPLTWFNWVA